MILDGYTQHETIGGVDGEVTLSFRPLLRHERDYWKNVLLVQGEQRLYWLLCQMVEWWSRGEVSEAAMEAARRESPRMFVQVWRKVCGVGQAAEETEEAKRVKASARLLVQWPHLWGGDVCGYCRKWWYDPIGNTTERMTDGSRAGRCGALLCETREGCPRGSWKSPVQVPDRHVMAYRHWRECRVSGFPDDGIVRRNARIFESAWTSFAKK